MRFVANYSSTHRAPPTPSFNCSGRLRNISNSYDDAALCSKTKVRRAKNIVLHRTFKKPPTCGITQALHFRKHCTSAVCLVFDNQDYLICKPPSTNSVVPVMKEASFEAIQRIG